MDDDRYRRLQLLRLLQPEGGMEVFELLAVFCVEQFFPKPFEGRFVWIEDLAELAAVVPVDHSDQVGRAKVVCDRPFPWFMRNWPNHFVQGCTSQ